MDRIRRQFLQVAAMAPMGLALPWFTAHAGQRERDLNFYHTHTGEKLSIVYHDGQEYLPDSLSNINEYLRDFRTGELHSIDPGLLDQLYALRQLTESRGVFEVISGYRSPKTNAKLRSRSKGVAKRSFHMQGRAIDTRLTDVSISNLRKAALTVKSGGVGYYRKSNFLHLDTGRFRTWG
ncbi:MAG: DUF882 domain-containing protein [Gammaproteobacteria bacterium]|nr:DUF882 domain-containing protein [Gammaproteobacteria bacterium]